MLNKMYQIPTKTIFVLKASLAMYFPQVFLMSTVLLCLPATNRIVPRIPYIGLVTAEGGTSFLTGKKTSETKRIRISDCFVTILEN